MLSDTVNHTDIFHSQFPTWNLRLHSWPDTAYIAGKCVFLLNSQKYSSTVCIHKLKGSVHKKVIAHCTRICTINVFLQSLQYTGASGVLKDAEFLKEILWYTSTCVCTCTLVVLILKSIPWLGTFLNCHMCMYKLHSSSGGDPTPRGQSRGDPNPGLRTGFDTVCMSLYESGTCRNFCELLRRSSQQ